MLRIDGAKHQVLMGSSPMDVANWLAATKREWSYSSSTRGPLSHSWDLGASWEQTLDMAAHGWRNGMLKLYDALSATVAPTTSHVKLSHSVEGHWPDVPRFLDGDPMNMVRRGKQHGNKPVIYLVVNMTTSGAVDAHNYANFGLALAATIDRLEAGGRRVELDVLFANAARVDRLLVGWKVKRADEHMDLDAVAFSVAHPAAYRRLGFGLWERTRSRNESMGYGHCSDLTAADVALLDSPEAFIINCTGMTLSACRTPADAMAFVRVAMNKAAGEEIVELEGAEQ